MIVLPQIKNALQITKSLATLDLLLSPEWNYRYYSFNSQWSELEQMASMKNGSGDEWFFLFHDDGWAGLKGFAHESSAALNPGLSKALQSAVPDVLKSFSQEPAFSWENTTFCFWSMHNSSDWIEGPLPNDLDSGSGALLNILHSGAKGYVKFASEYYEQDLDAEIVDCIFEHRPLNNDLIVQFNTELTIDDISVELIEIGYPM